MSSKGKESMRILVYTANGEIAHALFKSKNYGSPGNLIFLNYQIKPKKMKFALRLPRKNEVGKF